MHHPNPLNFATLPIPKLISRSPLWRTFSVVLLALAFTFALSQAARAVDPPPDGGYPNQNTAEGDGALFSLTTGSSNTATGGSALYSNTTGGANTANGFYSLRSNTTGNNNTASGVSSLYSNTTGSNNTADGTNALF